MGGNGGRVSGDSGRGAGGDRERGTSGDGGRVSGDRGR